MTVVSYRIYCDECPNSTVLRESEMDDSPWKINAKHQHSGVCPACDPSVQADGEYADAHQEVPFEDLDNIGESGAENLREAGISTKQEVRNASDDDILDVSWVGEAGLKSIRDEV